VKGIAEIAVIAGIGKPEQQSVCCASAIRLLCIKEVTRTLKPYWFKVSVFLLAACFLSQIP